MAEKLLTEVSEAQSTRENWGGGEAPMKASFGKLMMWYFLLSDAFTFCGFLAAYGALRLSVPTWPVPDFVFQSFPGGFTGMPLIFVTLMSFVLIASSVTMVRAVQEGKRENRRGVVFWLILTIIGGFTFLGCQAYEWYNLIAVEHMTVFQNPFGTHTVDGIYLDDAGNETAEVFRAGDSYLVHKGDDGEWNYRNFRVTSGDDAGLVATEILGPQTFGSLFFCITGFHGFHVSIGVFLLIVACVNAASGLYDRKKTQYETVEKIGLYWHFVDLVWVFVFLVFYLL